MSVTLRLLRILGRRAFITFGLVTFLVGALLATVNLTSRYALKVYVEDQLSRMPWDLAIYQLMRLRGISGRAMGRALQIAIVAGGAVGGVLGVIAGSIIPLLIYERGSLPLELR